ncbi:MAG: UDP-N-acetylglucosamine diphosphorylase [Candidatus Bipolaricaulota bacterium]
MKIISLDHFFDISQTDYPEIYEDLEYPWEVIPRIADVLQGNLEACVGGTIKGNAWIGDEVSVGEGTVVEPGAVIKGPAIIGKNCEVRSGAYIRKNVIVGNDVVVGHSTELKNSLVHDSAEIPHFAYVGDSVIGWKGHLGAGVKISNFKVTREQVRVHLQGETYRTGLRKFGCLLGDRVELGCNSVVNPGTLLGKGTLSVANASLRGYYPPDSFVKIDQNPQTFPRGENQN